MVSTFNQKLSGNAKTLSVFYLARLPSPLDLKINPVPINPTPVTTPAAIREGSTLPMEINHILFDIMLKQQDATEINT